MRLTWTHVLALLALLLYSMLGCANTSMRAPVHPEHETQHNVAEFLKGLVRAWPVGSTSSDQLALAVTGTKSERVSTYDNALLALYLMRSGQRPEAARILAALAKLQLFDGSLPFSFGWPAPDPHAIYVRTGAIAWVGYAAAEYLDAESGGDARMEITALAHGVANYLLAHQINEPSDQRNGLVLGGFGSYTIELHGAEEREIFVPGDVSWASTEHNIDAYFFLRDFARITGDRRFQTAAEHIQAGLLRGWLSSAGQLVRGFDRATLDKAYALDCASWGALFLLAARDETRAATSMAVAEGRYLSREDKGVPGHRPYAHARILANPELAERYRSKLGGIDWDEVDAVWPEGSAGVALAALRLGRPKRAAQILEHLEKLRQPNGGLPNLSLEIPFEFDTLPSLAGTVWVELVRYELQGAPERETLWRRR